MFFLLKTEVMSASFSLSGKFPVFNKSLKRLCKTSGEASEFIFNILGRILSLLVAFLGLIGWTFFSMFNLDIGLKDNLFWFTNLSLMSKMIGWNLFWHITWICLVLYLHAYSFFNRVWDIYKIRINYIGVFINILSWNSFFKKVV